MWPHEEAGRLARHVIGYDRNRVITFETGYGPSGAPHIGTIAEILRTSYVRRAFFDITGRPSRLICFSDDLDALRKVPENMSKELLGPHLGRSLCDIPNPEGNAGYTSHPGVSFAQANIDKMIQLVTDFGYTPIVGDEALKLLRSGDATNLDEVICINSSDCYRRGFFNDMLVLIGERMQDVLDVVLPTLGGTGSDRKDTYCPFMPILENGIVIQNLRESFVGEDLNIHWTHNGEANSWPIESGCCKLQWKVDWCMRWAALGVDFEMHGKDLQSSVEVGKAILDKLGLSAPITMQYELFLDETGAKTSKSKGNGIDINAWARYGIDGALNFFLTHEPYKARIVSKDTILIANDSLLSVLRNTDLSYEKRSELFYVYGSKTIPTASSDLTFTNVLNLVDLMNTTDLATIAKMISEYHPELTINKSPILLSIICAAINYYNDVIQPTKTLRSPTEAERVILDDLAETILNLDEGLDAEKIQYHIYECGKRHVPQKELKKFFQMIYEVLLGAPQGPRLGTMILIIGRETFIQLLRSK